MISRYLEAIHLLRQSRISLSLFLYTLSFSLVTRPIIIPPPLTECQLELARYQYHSEAPEHPSGPSGLFYWDEDTAASKMHACEMHACERYVPARDVRL